MRRTETSSFRTLKQKVNGALLEPHTPHTQIGTEFALKEGIGERFAPLGRAPRTPELNLRFEETRFNSERRGEGGGGCAKTKNGNYILDSLTVPGYIFPQK